MTGLTHPHFPVMLVDDEVQALNSFELTLRSANMNHFISVRDSREVMGLLITFTCPRCANTWKIFRSSWCTFWQKPLPHWVGKSPRRPMT